MVATRSQNDPDEMERVRRMVYGGRSRTSTGRKKNKWADHYKHDPVDHDLESTIDQIRNSTGKYKHTKSKKSKKDNYKPKSINDLENSGKLPKSGGSIMPIMMGVVFVAIIMVIGMPMLEQMSSIDSSLGGQNTTSGWSATQNNAKLIEDNMFTILFLLPIVAVVMIVVRMFN